MEILIDTDTGTSESWAFVREGARIELGAQAVPNDEPTEFAVVWRACVGVGVFRNILNVAHEVMTDKSQFRGTLTGYGPTKEFLNLRQFLASEPHTMNFQAYRADLEIVEGAVSVWANVAEGDTRGLNEAADNIGLCVPASSFRSWGRNLITFSIERTRKDFDPESIRKWLDKLSDELLQIWPEQR